MATSKAGRIILWTIQGWAVLAFVVIGFGKFHNPFWAKAFPKWGYSDSFRMLIGVLEMLGGALLAFPRTALYAAVLIDVILLGAAWTLVTHHERAFPPLFWLIVISIVGYARRRQAWRPAGRDMRAAVDTV